MSKGPSWHRTVIVALVMLLVGGTLLAIGNGMASDNGWRILFFNVGSFVIASVVMALIFQFWQLRGLLDDLWHHANVSEQLRRSKIVGFSSSAFYPHVPWAELFGQSSRVRIVFAYARSWRNTHRQDLENFLRRRGAHLQVILPDPNHNVTINEMAYRFDYTPDQLRDAIEEAATDLLSLGSGKLGKVEIYYFARSLTYSSYLFDGRAVFATYRHGDGRGNIITLQAERGGELYAWIEMEWDQILAGKLSRPRS